MAVAGLTHSRLVVEGKFFRLGADKFYVKGLCYGPFAPNAAGFPFASPEQTVADFRLMRELGANAVRIYQTPAKWFLDLATDHDLKLLIDVPWNKQLCFLDSPEHRRQARDDVRRAVLATARHPAVLAYSIANEIPPDIVRWSGVRPVSDFIDELVREAKSIDPDCLCTFTNYPPTEFLRPETIDFLCFNVYLHRRPAFRNYLARLQMLAESKPLVLGEFGLDSLREGEERQAEFLDWQIEQSFRSGLAGAFAFSFTDDWWHAGRPVEDWQMGVTTRERRPKRAAEAVKRQFAAAPLFPLARYPKVSVVVASYNGGRTLKACLDSLTRQRYPDFEILLVDDGSTDNTPEVAAACPRARCIRHERNLGLSAARNTGLAAATGEIIAFTDSDCRADEDWLYYSVSGLLEGDFAAIGGPNLLPPEDSSVAAAVMASPGGPAHVMLTDRQAEHIPGCNMSFYEWALEEIGGFDPIFRKAGDDVDICWRLQQAGYKIGFSPAAFVWHYRRSTVADYLKQQRGYGEAEALLVRKHPEYFNSFGGSIWRGRIYTASRFGVSLRPSVIYRGLFGSAGFQSLYASEPALTLMLCTALEYHVLVTLPLWVLSVTFHPLLPVAIASLLVSLAVCVAAGAQARLPRAKKHWWSRPLVAALFFLQPIVRGWARYQGRLEARRGPVADAQSLDSLALRDSGQSLNTVGYWTASRLSRYTFLAEVLRRLDQQGWPHKSDIGWGDYDVEISGSRWSSVQLATVTEDHANDAQVLRCRLRPRWSLPARVAFWGLLGLEVLVLGFVARPHPWLWIAPLATLPLLAWVLRRDRRNLQSILAVLLDGIAKEWNMVKIRPVERPGRAAEPASESPPPPGSSVFAPAAQKPE